MALCGGAPSSSSPSAGEPSVQSPSRPAAPPALAGKVRVAIWDEVRDVYTKDYGDPVGTYREIRHAVFERSYTRVNITVDCNTQNATYTWI